MKKAQVLIVAHSDGYIEAFGDSEEVSIKIVRSVDCRPENEGKAEDMLNESLPMSWRELHWPTYLRASLMNRPLTVDNVLQSQAVRVLNELHNSIGSTPAGTPSGENLESLSNAEARTQGTARREKDCDGREKEQVTSAG